MAVHEQHKLCGAIFMSDAQNAVVVSVMRRIIELYDAGDVDVIQTFELECACIPPVGGWTYPAVKAQSRGYTGTLNVSFVFPMSD